MPFCILTVNAEYNNDRLRIFENFNVLIALYNKQLYNNQIPRQAKAIEILAKLYYKHMHYINFTVVFHTKMWDFLKLCGNLKLQNTSAHYSDLDLYS